mmetsp:Transcript_28081/g.76195  ORF Transcript_28081/g.76195 Transcript_28081/m.76195 type:complete len:333 (-) Transcript_28081:328-1326(-)
MGSEHRHGSNQRHVCERFGGSHHQALGPGQGLGGGLGRPQADPDRTHFSRPRAGLFEPPPVPLLGRRRQDGKVLGPGNEPGDPPLPRPPERGIFPETPPDAGPAGNGGSGRSCQGLGHSHQDPDPRPGGARQHRRVDSDAVHRSAGGDREHGLHHQAMGPGGRQVHDDPDAPPKERPGPCGTLLRKHVCVGSRRLAQALAGKGREVSEILHGAQGRRQRHGRQRRRGLGQRGRRRKPSFLGLQDGLQLSIGILDRSAGVPRRRERHFLHRVRRHRHTAHHGRGRQDDQDLEGGREFVGNDRSHRHGGLEKEVHQGVETTLLNDAVDGNSRCV